MQQNLTEWDQDVVNNPEEDYQAFLRGLLWHDGFELAFVRCSPAGGVELIQKVRDDLPQKQIGVLELNEPIDNLINIVKDFPNQSQLDILFISGLEKSLIDYIHTGYGGDGDYYNLDTIPPILSHLNWQRENFRDKFHHLCFVFLLPRFAIKYILRRAPDFFDWGSGVVEFPTSRDLVAQESQRIMLQGGYQEYLGWTSQQRTQKIIEIEELLTEPNQTQNRQVSLLVEQGNVLSANKQYEEAIASYDKALEFKPDYQNAWHVRGIALSALGRYEEAITSFDRALQIKPDDQAWNNRGAALDNLGRYEEAIVSFDQALQFKPDYQDAWNNRGAALGNLGRYEEAIISFDQALQFKPDLHEAWYNRGIVLGNLERYEEAITSFDQALQFRPDLHQAWNNQGNMLGKLKRYEEAITSFDQALQFKPDLHQAWNNRGSVLGILERYEEAIASYDQALQIKPDNAWYIRGIALSALGRYEEAIASFDQALQFKPDDNKAWHN